MTYPRAHLVDEKNSGYYHCTSRCVRRAWLCGNDPVTGNSYAHRKDWLEGRILRLANCFAIDLCAYAIMSNHYHVVVRTDPKRAIDWPAAEVARRWLSRQGVLTKREMAEKIADLIASPSRIRTLRARLSSLSWFMRNVNEPMARIANAEDDCKGRFWEGRFKSVALLDRNAVINCMVYVELNPARANGRVPIPSNHTSAAIRTTSRGNRLTSLADLELTTASFLELVQWTHGRTNQNSEKQTAPPKILASLNQSETVWLRSVQAHAAWYRAYGPPETIERYVKKLKQCWIQMPRLRKLASNPESTRDLSVHKIKHASPE